MARRKVTWARPIKPSTLNVDAVRLELLNAQRKEGRLQRRELKKTTASWTGAKPKIDFDFTLPRTGTSTLTVGPVDDGSLGYKKWVWLNEGTPPHPIAARRAPLLAFRVDGFRPKTRPHALESTSGALPTGPLRRPIRVQHPGGKARNWTGILYKRRKVPYRNDLQAAVNRGTKKARRRG